MIRLVKGLSNILFTQGSQIQLPKHISLFCFLIFQARKGCCTQEHCYCKGSGTQGSYIFNILPPPASECLLEVLERHFQFSLKTGCAFLRLPGDLPRSEKAVNSEQAPQTSRSTIVGASWCNNQAN